MVQMNEQKNEKEKSIPATFATFVTEQTGHRPSAKSNKDDLPILQEMFVEYVNYHMGTNFTTFDEANAAQEKVYRDQVYERNKESIKKSNARSRAKRRILKENPNISDEDLEKEMKKWTKIIEAKRQIKEEAENEAIEAATFDSRHPGFNWFRFAKESKKKAEERNKLEESQASKGFPEDAVVISETNKADTKTIAMVTTNNRSNDEPSFDTSNVNRHNGQTLLMPYNSVEDIRGYKESMTKIEPMEFMDMMLAWMEVFFEEKDFKGKVVSFPEFTDTYAETIIDVWRLPYVDLKMASVWYGKYIELYKKYNKK